MRGRARKLAFSSLDLSWACFLQTFQSHWANCVRFILKCIGTMLKRTLLITIGVLSLALGIVGVFLPLLPTTPFLLLSAACFLKSSPALYAWLVGHRWFGRDLENYLKHKAVSRRSKIVTIVFLWVTMSISVSAVSLTWVRLLLFVVALAVTIHLLLLKTLDRTLEK
jgi:uncharacterized membrane protein YbaN (DUF454 family)